MLNIGTIIANLKLVDTLTPALNKAQASLKRLGPNLKQTGANMRATGTSMTIGLTAPIVAGVAAAGIAFGSFEKSMNRVKALTGATGADFEQMSAQAKELGKTTAFSASEASDAMGFLAMAGFSTTAIIGAMPGVLELAASAQIDLASAADITSNIMTGYGQTTEDLAKTNNILVQAMTSANVDLRMLGESMKFVGPVAKSAGVSFEEATAAIALMGNAGIQGSMAGTALRGAITKLLTPTKKAATEMRNLGLQATDAEGNLLPMSDIVQQLGDKSATTAQMMTIFGLRAGPAMAGLVSQGHEALRKMTGELEGVGNVAQRIAEIQLEGLSGAFTRFKSASNGAMIEIGEKLAPVLESFLDTGIRIAAWITDTLVPAFAALSPTTQKWIIGLVAAVAAAGPFLIVLGSLFTALGTIGAVLAPLLPLFGFVAGGFSMVSLAASPLLPLIALLVAGFALFKFAMWAKEVQFFGRALDKLKNIFGVLSDEEYDAAKAARRFNEDLGDVTPTAEDLREALGVAGVEGTVAELHTAMVNLGGVAGALADDEMALLAHRAIELRNEGETLTPALEQIADQFIREGEEAEAAAQALEENAQRTAALNAAVVSLRDELSDAGLAGDLETLEGAWAALDDSQQDNVLTWQRAGDAALKLEQRGEKLTGALSNLASTSWLAAQPLPTLNRGYLETSTSAKGLAVPIETLIKILPKVSTGAEVYGEKLEVMNEAQFEALQAATALPSVFEQLGNVLGGVAADMNDVFIAAFEGGGAALGALKSLATNAAEGFLNMIPVVGPFLSQFAGPIIAGIGKIGSALAGLFGRSTTENLRLTASRMWGIVLTDSAARAATEMAEQVGDDFGGLVLSLGVIIEEAGGVMAVGFERTAGAARTMFNAIDQGKIDADQALTGLLPVLQAMALEFENADAAGQAAFLELIKLASEFGLDMQAIVGVIGQDLVDQALGNDLPGSLQKLLDGLDDVSVSGLDPLLARLVSLGVITEAQRQEFMEMAGQAVFDMRRAEEAAERWGIALADLGPRYQNAKLGEQALSIAADFDILFASGMAVADIIDVQGDAIHAVVRDARWAGTAIPEAMRPAIQAWIDQGGAIDENGELITDISQIDFAKPMEERLASVLESLAALIQKFIDALAPVENLTTEIENIPDADVAVRIHMDDVPEIHIPDVTVNLQPEWRDDFDPTGGFAHGTHGRFLDFGSGTPVVLHGRERITPLAEAQREAGGASADMHVVEERLTSIERLLRDQPRAFGLAVQDSMTLSH